MKFFEQMDMYLKRKGMKEPLLRNVFKNLFLFSALISILGLIFFVWTPVLFWIGIFSIISGCNFYFLARSILEKFFVRHSVEHNIDFAHSEFVKKNIILGSTFRLFILGILMYIAIVYRVNIIAITLGLSAPVIIIICSIFSNRSSQE